MGRHAHSVPPWLYSTFWDPFVWQADSVEPQTEHDLDHTLLAIEQCVMRIAEFTKM